jgi:hypothetical protein
MADTKKSRGKRHANPLIERWTNAARVLDAMPAHERRKHWNMATWGEKTDCGTVACAAGHCGLDPWFRRRGFRLDFNKDQSNAKISDVSAFFGFEGTSRIFFNSDARPVSKVLGEVRAYVAELRKIDSLTADLPVPAIGAEWPEQGGIYAGARLGVDGAPDYLLIVGPEYDGYIMWDSAGQWAAALSVGVHRDFVLPDRGEGTALFTRVPSLFKQSWYWLSPQPAALSSCAWAQDFGYGSQYLYRKGRGCRARALRRVPIRSFGNSVISGGGK